MRLNIREVKRVGSTGAKVTLNIMEGSSINQVTKGSVECIELIQQSELYDCRMESFRKLNSNMKLYAQISEDIKSGKCELY